MATDTILVGAGGRLYYVPDWDRSEVVRIDGLELRRHTLYTLAGARPVGYLYDALGYHLETGLAPSRESLYAWVQTLRYTWRAPR